MSSDSQSCPKGPVAVNNNDIKGRRSKLAKKAAKGQINTEESYAECVSLGIKGLPQFSVVQNTKNNPKFDFKAQDLRELLTSVMFDKQTPRQFQITNKPFIRNIINIHLSNCANPVSLPQEYQFQHGYTVRVSNALDPVIQLSSKLLTVAVDEEEATQEGFPPAEGYVMSDPTLQLWGYPTIDTVEGPFALPPVENGGEESENPSKRRKICLSEADGLLAGLLPTQEQARAIADKLSGFLSLHTVQKKDNCKFPLTGFLSSLSSTSEAYRVLQTALLEALPALQTLPVTKVVAIDCEMCEIGGKWLSLTRCSIVNDRGEVLLDALVKPSEPITDYLTPYSGITEDSLREVDIGLLQVQLMCLYLLPSDAIAVGHSLDNDLRALKISHPRCVDTALLYPHSKGYPFKHKLKHLAQQFLRCKIQSKEHDSIEDAATALRLFQLKIEKGPSFGLPHSDMQLRQLLLSAGKGHRQLFHFTSREDHDYFSVAQSGPAAAVSSDVAAMEPPTAPVAIQLHQEATACVEAFQRSLQQEEASQQGKRFLYLGLDWTAVKELRLGAPPSADSGVPAVEGKLALHEILDSIRRWSSSSLVVVSCQPTKQTIDELKARKAAIKKHNCAATWNAENEMELQENISYYHTGRAYFAVLGGN